MKIELTTQDLQTVGDHYWGYDYYPEHHELVELARILNEKIAEKIEHETHNTQA